MIPFSGPPESWNEIIANLPITQHKQQTHYMQTWCWSQAKARTGWKPFPFIWEDEGGKPVAAAMVFRHAIPIPGLSGKLCILYVPRGPLMDWENAILRQQVLADLETYARKQGAIYLKIDPDVAVGTGVPGEPDAVELPVGQEVEAELKKRRWFFSKEQVETRNTMLVDLTGSEEEVMNRMRKNTRQKIRHAQKVGVTVRKGTLDDLPVMWSMFRDTEKRAGLRLRDEGHYQFIWRNFMSVPHDCPTCQPFVENLIAEVECSPVAAITLLICGDQELGLYGMSNGTHHEKMPNYLIQWESMRLGKSLGCNTYDLYGVPDEFTEESRLWSVYRFKEGFGGTVYRGIGGWDYIPDRIMLKILYWLYMDVLPVVRDILDRPGPPYTNLEARHQAREARKRKRRQAALAEKGNDPAREN
jgi:lipid II:glycine glycyltransferase (peptidoglycan interpeptide bridge formation enzyme)